MITTQKKRGRQAKDWKDTKTGDTINGLYRKPNSNVWRIRATGQEFTEAVEAEAIRRFFEITQGEVRTVDLPVTIKGEPKIDPTGAPYFAPPGAKPRKQPKAPAGIQIKVDEEGNVHFVREVDEAEFIAAFKNLMQTRREWLAKMSGIEKLAWIDDVEKPKASPKLTDVVEHYAKKPGLSHDETVRARKQWEEFRKATGADTLKDITHEAVAKYETKLAGENLSPKSVKHRYTKIKTVVAHAMKRGVNTKECRAALDVLAMLEVPDATPLAPHPINVDHFWAIHDKAVAEGDAAFAAMMLTAANCCMYSGEVAALKWDEINLKTGEVVTARPKTGVARVAVLWPETVAALKALPRLRDFVFFSERRSYTTNLVSRHFADYRDKAELADTIKFGDIRDAAYTYACRSVSLDKAKILAGHRLSGATDHYVQRNPGFVKDACDAIRREFYPAKPAKVKAA